MGRITISKELLGFKIPKGVTLHSILSPYFDQVAEESNDSSKYPATETLRVSKVSQGIDFLNNDEVEIVFKCKQGSTPMTNTDVNNIYIASINGVSTQIVDNNNDYNKTSKHRRYRSKG